MDPERFRRIEALFHRALELPAPEREAFLARECGEDGRLAAEVLRLLDADGRALEGVERLELFGCGIDPLVGRQIGAWLILERVAEGGMGMVYRAERADRMFEQQVAIKLLRLEVATEDALRRFELERHLLARLEHPHIARMLDGGRSELGTPYLVMEFVDGLPIDRWCEEHGLALEERLRLFAQVCRAMHFAHQRLIVHRDIKPSNIMVDRHGQPKLLDFGIGRFLDDDESLPTLTGARLLTPQYASPEQLQGSVLTTATDVYSLGVVLYELLTGRRPWRRTGRSPAEWERIVSSEEPTRPSTAVQPRDAGLSTGATAFAAHMGTSPARLQRRLRGDLDRIVLMALRKEPGRRYASAEQLAEDLERFLGDQPVRARRDTLGYRAQRFVKRNRLAVGASVLVLLALCVGLYAAWRGRILAEAAAEHAAIEASSFQHIAHFLGDTLLRSADDESRRAMVARIVELQAAQVRRQHANAPHLRANLLDALGKVYAQLEILDPAEELLREASAIRLASFGESTMEHALSLGSLGQLAYQRGAYARAAELLSAALELHRAIPGDVHSDIALASNDLAAALRKLGRLDEARALHERALELRRSKGEPGLLDLAESLNNLAIVLLEQRDPNGARTLIEEGLEIRERILGSHHGLTLQMRNVLAGVEWQLGRPEAAERHLQAAVEGHRELGPSGREGLVHALANLSRVQVQRGELEPAARNAQEALERTLERHDADHPQTALARSRVAPIHTARKEHEAARAEWEEVLRVHRRVYPPEHPLLAHTLHQLGLALVEGGGAAQAEPHLAEALRILEGAPDPAVVAPERAALDLTLGVCALSLERREEARARLESARDAFMKLEGEGSVGAQRARNYLALLEP